MLVSILQHGDKRVFLHQLLFCLPALFCCLEHYQMQTLEQTVPPRKPSAKCPIIFFIFDNLFIEISKAVVQG